MYIKDKLAASLYDFMKESKQISEDNCGPPLVSFILWLPDA